MALDVLEWGVILVMGAGILLWGPDKIPEMAKTLAAAKKEFDGATKQLQGITKELQTGLNTGNLSLDTISNAIIGAGTAAGIPGNPSPAEIAKATAARSGAPAPSAAMPAPLPSPPKKSADEMLVEMARSLNIDTKGKTREEISQAIMDQTVSKPVEAPPVQDAAVEAPQAALTDSQTQSENEPVAPSPQ